MKYRTVEIKGLKLDVFEDARIRLPAYESAFVRNGKPMLWRGKEQFLRPQLTAGGYLEVVKQSNESRRLRVLLHRLVAIAWVPGYQEGLTVNHIDGNKMNNMPSNLEWVTKSENSRHQWRTGLAKRSRADFPEGAKLSADQVADIVRRRKSGENAKHLGQEFGVSFSLVYRLARQAT